jgi:hypothetical protein
MAKNFMSGTPSPTSVLPAIFSASNTTTATGATSYNSASPAPGNVNSIPGTANPYKHTTSDNPASATADYTINFLPNVLDNYDTWTYHWKLFITSTANASSGDVLTLANQTIIAESGVSDLTIDKVEMQGIATPTVSTGTGTETGVKFEIVEPAGAGLLDQMYYESLALGIGNWWVMPFFLQLEFRGRDPITGETVTTGSSAGLGALKWVWPVKITDIKANVTQVGTRYEFTAVMYDEIAQSNNLFSLRQNVTLRELTTFGKAMKDLQTKLNADAYEQLIDNYSIPDTFRIVVDPLLSIISLINPEQGKSTSRGSDYQDFSKKAATFSTGTGIDKIIDNLLGSTATYGTLTQNSATSTSEPNPASAETNQMKKLWRIITETQPIAFDALRQDNAKAITIFVVQYDLGATDVNAAQTGGNPADIPASKKRFNEYIQNKILNKRYDYIFTGLNDQIINLDLNMNLAFATVVSRYGGNYYDSAIRDKGAQQKNTDQFKNVTEQLRQTLQWINNAPAGTNVDSKVQQTQNAIKAANLNQDVADRYTALLNTAKPPTKTNFSNQTIIAEGGITTNGKSASNSNLEIAAAQARLLAQPVGTNGSRFISDINVSKQTTNDATAVAQSLGGGKLRPIPTVESNQEKTLNNNIDSSSDPARSRVSNIFAQALYSSMGSMQNIKLTVKGDPYWLFPRALNTYQDKLQYKANMSETDAIAQIKSSQLSDAQSSNYSVNLFGTDNFIIVRFRTPRIFNTTTGLNDPHPVDDPYTEIETFSGVYKVTEIISKCEMGKFTQELHCILDPVINLTDFKAVLSRIEYASMQHQQTVNNTIPSNSAIAASAIPITAISTKLLDGPLLPGQTVSKPGVPQNSIGPDTTGTSNIPSTINFTPSQLIAQTIAGKT